MPILKKIPVALFFTPLFSKQVDEAQLNFRLYKNHFWPNNLVCNFSFEEYPANLFLSDTPFLVPHRDEFTETVGFNIQSGNYKTIFIPDIDKWDKFDRSITEIIMQSDLALLDGTFYKDGELQGRAMNEIPHPFIEESFLQFATLPASDKSKIRFIHFKLTNPMLDENSDEFRKLQLKGFKQVIQGEILKLN